MQKTRDNLLFFLKLFNIFEETDLQALAYFLIGMEKIIDEKIFKDISDYIYRNSGITIRYAKEYHVRNKLKPIAEELNLSSFAELAEHMKKNGSVALRDKVISAVTVNETSFFRDKDPFRILREILLPDLAKNVLSRKAAKFTKSAKPFNILSAPCSTGQEPYSIAMTIFDYLEAVKPPNLFFDDFRILAFDIDMIALDKAKKGVYQKYFLDRELTDMQLSKHFDRASGIYRVKPHLKKIIEFKVMSLLDDVYIRTKYPLFDIIFLRNVLIYFNKDTRRKIMNFVSKALAPEGKLILGSSENIYGFEEDFETINMGKTLVYRKRDKK